MSFVGLAVSLSSTFSDSLTEGFSAHFLPDHFSGFVIVGEDNTGKLDLGIFIASIVPDGPADKDGRIKPGTKHRHWKPSNLAIRTVLCAKLTCTKASTVIS